MVSTAVTKRSLGPARATDASLFLSQLGIPTANIPIDGLTVGGHSDIESGVYYGWAGLSPSSATSGDAHGGKDSQTKGTVYPMVMSIGWNPFYKNTVRSVEVHIIHKFAKDFYGSHMNLDILGFIRPEYDYVSKESLIEDIQKDIEVTGNCLARPAYAKYRDDGYLVDFEGKGKTAN